MLQMPFAQKQRRRRQIELQRRAGHGQQRIHILFARLGHVDHGAVHGLLARQLNLAQQPPDGRMEPQARAHQLLGQHRQPVAPPHVQNFVAEDGVLQSGVEFREIRRQQNHGFPEPEGDRAGDFAATGADPLPPPMRAAGSSGIELRR